LLGAPNRSARNPTMPHKKLAFMVLLAFQLEAQVVLRVPVGGAPASFDPHLMTAPFPFHAQFVMQIFESPLETKVDEKGLMTVVPALCELPAISPDGLRVTLTVRKGARFQDDACFEGGRGREVTARDVAYSILRHADPGVRSASYPIFVEHRFKGVDEWREAAAKLGRPDYDTLPEGIRVEGAAVVLELLAPYPQLRALLTQPWASVIPHEAVKQYGSGFGDHPVGTGPFRLADVDAARVRMVKNPTYRMAGLPKVDELRLEIVSDPAAQAARYLAGDLDILSVFAPNERQIVDGKSQLLPTLKVKGHSLSDGVPLSVSYVVFNTASPVLGKLEMRQALTLALDRDRISREGQGDRVARADHPLPSTFPEAAQIRLEPWDLGKRDVARAKELLAKAGYADPSKLSELILDVPADAPDPRADRAMKTMVSQFADIGIKVRIRSEKFMDFAARASSGDFHFAWLSWYADYPDAENFLLLFRSDKVAGGDWGSNYGRYSDPLVDELYVKIGNRLPGLERTADVTTLLRKVRADCAWIPFSFPAPLCALNRGVDGYRANVLNFSLRDVGKKP
jgi:peptide/nickel transport system substrate-binding protein